MKTYPKPILTEPQRSAAKSFDMACEKLGLRKCGSAGEDRSVLSPYKISKVQKGTGGESRTCDVVLEDCDAEVDLKVESVPCGPLPSVFPAPPSYCLSRTYETALTSILQHHHSQSDVIVISEKGAGKSAATKAFGDVMGYRRTLFSLYKDMTSRGKFYPPNRGSARVFWVKPFSNQKKKIASLFN